LLPIWKLPQLSIPIFLFNPTQTNIQIWPVKMKKELSMTSNFVYISS
jgi:hypothetical protein